MSDECRHGFDAGLCAICFPPKVFEKDPAEVRATAAKARATRAARTARSVSPARLVRVNEQRLYHVTHVRNLPSILESGSVLSDDSMTDAAEVTLSSEENRDARRRIAVADGPVSAYVPFFLSPDAAVWHSIRSREPNVRIANTALRMAPNDFVVLVTSVASVRELAAGELVIADGDAAAGLTRFATEPEQVDRMLARFSLDDDNTQQLAAEALVRGSLPVTSLSMIGVPSIKQRERVKRMLSDAGYKTKVAAYQPWFTPEP